MAAVNVVLRNEDYHIQSILAGGESLYHPSASPIKKWVLRLLNDDKDIPASSMRAIRTVARNIVLYEASAPRREAEKTRLRAKALQSRLLVDEANGRLANLAIDTDHWTRPADC